MLKPSIIVPFIRLDLHSRWFTESHRSRFQSSFVSSRLDEVADLIQSLRAIDPSATIGLVANLYDLLPIVEPLESETAESDVHERAWQRIFTLIDSGAIEIIPTPMVRGLEDLACCFPRLHFHTALAIADDFSKKLGLPSPGGLGGLKTAEVDLINLHSEREPEYAVCDVNPGEVQGPSVSRSKNGIICFRCPNDCANGSLSSKVGPLIVHVVNVGVSGPTIAICSAKELPELLAHFGKDARMIGPRDALSEIVAPNWAVPAPVPTHSNEELARQKKSKDKVINRVEDLFLNLISRTAKQMLKSLRNSLEPQGELSRTGYAISALHCREALDKGAARLHIRISPHIKFVPATEGVHSSTVRTLEGVLSAFREGRSSREKVKSLTDVFLNIFAQSICAYRLHVDRSDEFIAMDAKCLAWTERLEDWADRKYANPVEQLNASPSLPNISFVQSLRSTLTWPSLRFDESALNLAANQILFSDDSTSSS
jgi:hypothetical protein